MIPRTLMASPYLSRSALVRDRFCSFIYQRLANHAELLPALESLNLPARMRSAVSSASKNFCILSLLLQKAHSSIFMPSGV